MRLWVFMGCLFVIAFSWLHSCMDPAQREMRKLEREAAQLESKARAADQAFANASYLARDAARAEGFARAEQIQASEPGQKLNVPSDPNADYALMSLELEGDLLFVITRRVGASGVAYSERAVRCATGSFYYTREDASLAGLRGRPRKVQDLTATTSKSISWYVVRAACHSGDEG